MDSHSNARPTPVRIIPAPIMKSRNSFLMSHRAIKNDRNSISCPIVRSEADMKRPDMSILNEQGQQRVAWQQRLVHAVLTREFDDETLVTMLMAGFEQAHEDGIRDAADICEGIAASAPAATKIARHIEKALRSLISLNKTSAIEVLDSDPARDVVG